MNWIKRHKKFTIFLVLAVLLLGWSRYDRHFTPRRWAETDIDHRGKLVNSLLQQYNGLVGMTREEVEELLGTYPDRSSEKISVLVYAAGGRNWTGFPEFLLIYLEDGRVTEVKTVVD